MKKLILFALLICTSCTPKDPEVARWEERARDVTITRDDWGVPHIRATTDANAIFGLIYAQAEDDFNRIEVNFLNSQGRLAEAEGEGALWSDLRMKLFIDPEEMRALYEESPEWLKDLMDGWADGLNYFLHTHPEVTPRILRRFEPWMALTFSEGSIGGDIERVSLEELEAFYAGGGEGRIEAGGRVEGEGEVAPPATAEAPVAGGSVPSGAEPFTESGAVKSSIVPVPALAAAAGDPFEPAGSNGIAIAPSNTVDGNALLLINPHTSFFFRHEAHVTSDEGLNAYGALTWGQFFIYQGFNETAGWMHTSSSVDNIDEFVETIVEREDGLFYRYGDEERPVSVRQVTVPYKTDTGMAQRDFTVYRTHHGPIVREVDGKWVAVALMEEPVKALIQSYSRTKAKNLQEYVAIMDAHTNSSNNTLFADAEGNIAYFHSNFVPVRDSRFDYERPVDGSDPATDWQGIHSFEDSPNVINPSSGWAYNTNNWPYSAAGPNSPNRTDYPPYMDAGSENFRGIHAIMLLENRTDFTLPGLMEAAYDSYLPGFQDLIPAVLRAYDRAPAGSPVNAGLADQIETLRGWDLRWGVASVPTSLAIFLGEALMPEVREAARAEEMSVYEYMATRASADQLLGALSAASARLEEEFGSWRTPWGEINRFQRLTGDIVQPFNDEAPSTPVGFTSSRWGSLASFGARPYPDTKRWYGTSGNSFVAVVEFGDSVRARAVTAGGLNSDPASPHFNDQAERYATGDLRDVHFYPRDIDAHAERVYRPGR
ncbi:MAG: penicillin acylase family protein [Longimicrobiales bacterium]